MLTMNDILYRVYANPILRNVRKVDVVDHVKSLTKLLNIPATFVEKSVNLHIKGFRAPLPQDLYKILGVTSLDTPGGTPGVRLKSTADSRIQHNRDNPSSYPTNVTYKEVPGLIYMDKEEADIEVIYTAFNVDENGFPLLPDNESLLKAIENYIKVQYFTILVETGHMPDKVLDRAEKQYEWYVGQATNSFATPTEDEAETIFDAIVRLIPNRDSFFVNFKYDSNTETLVNHD